MNMGNVDLKILCVLFFFVISVQRGFSEEYGARLGAKEIPLQRVRRQSKPAKPLLKVTDYHVRCSVMSRYAHTTIQSSVWNQLAVTKEAAFEVDLPSAAFISNFTITSNGKVHIAQVKERSAARKIYDAAKKQGKTAGLVATKEREIEKFRMAVSISSGSRISFSLSYEELLPRRLGRYELILGLRPGGLVTNLTLDVSIAERTGLSFIKVLPLKSSRRLSNTVTGETEAPASTQIQQSSCCARVHYNPSLQQQSSVSSKGLNADYIIQYDVELSDLMGDIQVFDGYFAHYFAPRGLPVVPKDVIFVIDVSGSMIGTKIKQTKQAMFTILGDLREGDHFNIITFSDKVLTWKKGRTVTATRNNVRDAKEFVKRIIAEGWTNINAALLSAAQLVNPSASSPSSSSSGGFRRVPLVIFLTDGEATIGVTSGDSILSNAKSALGSASLFGLAFGDDADFPLLRRLALDNRGMARMVYEDTDAALQLKGFYDEVASPLLSDIQLTYLDDQAFDVTRSLFPNYFQGSELVVTGKVKPGVKNLKVSLTASDSKQKVKVENDVLVSKGEENGTASSMGCPGGMGGISSFVRRLWAYFTIKELLLAKLNSTDLAVQKLLGEKATNLSLKFNFVTPVTSLVVVKPDADEIPTTASTTTAQPATTTTTKPTTTNTTNRATTTTTVAHTTATEIASPIPVKKPRSNEAKPDPHVTKLPPPQPPPQPRKASTLPSPAKTVAPPSSKKTTMTSTPSPSAGKTVPAPLSGKTPTPPPSSPKTAPAPPARIFSTPLANSLKTAAAPAPGKTTTTPPPNIVKTVPTPSPTTVKTTVPTAVKTTTSTTTSVRTDPTPALQPWKPATPLPISVRTVLPPVRTSLSSSSSSENDTMSATDAHPPQVTTFLYSVLSVSPTPAPQGSNTDPVSDVDQIATFVSATFSPMPGITDGPKLWEAAGLLDVSTSIQIHRKDMDLVKDYDATYDQDYDLNYDSWDESALNLLPDPTSRLSSVRVFSSSVDGDPHFMVQLPKLKQNLCFTVDGRANDVLRLLEDPERGITVDGHLMWAPSKQDVKDRSRTYFDKITISAAMGGHGGLGGIVITLSLDAVVVEGEGRDTLPTNQQGSVTRQGVAVSMDTTDDIHQSCWIELAKDICFLVLFHHYKQPSYLQMAHLGFYITDGQGLSPSTKGLLGQFQHADMSVTPVKDPSDTPPQPSKEGVLSRGVLRWGAIHVPITLQDKTLKDTVRKHHLGRCWIVPKAQVEKLLGHPYQSYVVDNI
ncbi:inter-alpha-trypsin inhibitor heavy chain H6 [Salmo trutta]|uniref:inter-alpha-trypsin inhibitor heavy chain H6 n=1 Tax=Salmo trutta TaxID=8032 RepID=UPI0011301116|nr:inter-alpha-trypsin inhibitor heavy chain H6-like [Salmo trutta]